MSILKLAIFSNRILNRTPLTFNKFVGIRSLSTAPSVGEPDNKTSLKVKAKTVEWKPIYKFRYIQHIASLNKLKFYQVVATIVCVPGWFILHSDDVH